MKVDGSIVEFPKITGKVKRQNELSGTVGAKTINIGGKPYGGQYVVTPRVYEQKLKTKGAIMNDDVTVKSIPFFNVGNQSGGSTAYIGSEG